VLALVVFTAIFAFAVTRIEARAGTGRPLLQKASGRHAGGRQLGAVAGADQVLGLAFAVGAGAGGAAAGAVLHYVVLVSLVGIVVTLFAYVVAIMFAGWKLGDFHER
jgi:hypothetical protein